MKPLTDEWVEKAEGDYIVAQKMFRARKQPVYDAVCFHSQQCAEKYLKAFLQEQEQDIPKTHNLVDLLKLCKRVDPDVEMLLSDLRQIERFSVNTRYPGTRADKDDARLALTAAKNVRTFLKLLLKIDTL